MYFGLRSGLNARARAVNFSAEELPELLGFLHRRGVKGYLTLNTLVFPGELEQFEQTARLAIAAGIDAVLVQDLGAARLLRELCPALPLHASTQMSLTSAEGIRVAERLGIQRVVLARELSLEEIRQIRRKTSVGLEVFVHGALCIGYSGQCLAGLAMGGRSGNRGQCAQPCRLPYRLIRDGREVDLGEQKYLLSPLDLAAYDLLPELITAGVDAVKIEGRLKSAEYVAAVTRHYRRAIDEANAGRRAEFGRQEIEELEAAFSRGFSHGWLEGRPRRTLVPGTSSAKRGVLLGSVRAVRGDRVAVELAAAVRRGDGVVFAGDRAEDDEQGGRVYEIFRRGQSVEEAAGEELVELAFGREALDLGRLHAGQNLWKTDDPQLARRLRRSYAGSVPQRRVALDLVVQAAVGSPLTITARTQAGGGCRLESPQPLAEARKHPLTAEVLREQFGRLGGTVYELRGLEPRIEGRPMAPLSVLGQLRHDLVRTLDEAATRPPKRVVAPESPLPALLDIPPLPQERAASLHVLCRTLEQLQAVLACGVASVMVEFRDAGQYREAVEAAIAGGAKILLATTRVEKPGETAPPPEKAEEGGQAPSRQSLSQGPRSSRDGASPLSPASLVRLLDCQSDGLLVRNLAAAAFCAEHGVPFVTDFSLHAANPLTVQYLRELGAGRVTAAYDLDRERLCELAAAVPSGLLEVVAYRHAPMFHTEHCVFCTTLGPGSDRTNCGEPCRRHDIRLRDRRGVAHPLRADAACRNTLYHADAQDDTALLRELLARGVRHFRVEFLDESDRESARVIARCRSAGLNA